MSHASTTQGKIPKDAQVIISILKEIGIQDYEPRVVNQLLEFTYRKFNIEVFVFEILAELHF